MSYTAGSKNMHGNKHTI